MDGTQQIRANRRDVMKAAAGGTAAAAMGLPMAGTAGAAHDDSEYYGVRVNQVGYPADGTKVAIGTSQAMDVSSASSFQVVDVDSGSVAHEGSVDGPNTTESGVTQDVVRAEFTDLSESGTYRVEIGDAESPEFQIDDASSLYSGLLRDVGRLYTLKRSNTEIDDPYTGLSYGPGHTQDEEAIVAEPTSGDWLEDYSAGDTISVPHGWYDAGDYGKYTNPAAVTVGQLLLAYERNSDAFHAGQFYAEDALVNPEDDWGDMPDVLVECKEELKFLEEMQRPNGSQFYKLSAKAWPDMTERPEDDDRDRYVFGCSSAGTAMSCAAFAMAARVYEEHDSEFADRMLENAEAAWSWLQDNEEVVWEMSDSQNDGSGAYGRQDMDAPDRYWAAAELYRTTGDSTYDDYIVNTDLSFAPYAGADPVSVPGDVEAPIDWNNPLGMAQYAYYWADGTDAGSTDTEGAAGGLTSSIWVAQRYNGGGSQADYWTTGTYGDYYWGWMKSGISRAVQGQWSVEVYDELGPDYGAGDTVQKLFKGPFHHALGRSPTGYSLVPGAGEKTTENAHDRIIQSAEEHSDWRGYIPGMMVGGGHNTPSIEEGDCTLEHISDSTPHLMSYVDRHCSYATNEWAINYTAPLFMMLAELVGEVSDTPEPNYDFPGAGEGGGDPGTPEPPTSPSDQWTNEVTSSSIEMGWESVDGATGYEVSLDGEMETTVTDGTTYTFTDLSPDTDYTIGIASVNDAGPSEMKESTVTTMEDGGDEPDEGVEVGEETVCDLDDDGLYEDINCDGEQTHADVQQFFEHQHRPAWKQPEMFDYSDNGDVNHGDVLALFEDVAGQSM